MAKTWDTLVRESDFVCPITQSIMRDPVYDTERNNYERQAIVHWLRTQEKKGETTSSPLTRNELREHWLQTNRDLRSRLAEWLIRHADDYDEARQLLKELCTVLPRDLYLGTATPWWYEGFMAKKATAPDDASADECFEIACLCAQGRGQSPFLNKSAPGWFERGAKLGHPEAQLQWAIHLHNERNDAEAVEWTFRIVPDWEDGEDEEDGEPWISHFWAQGKLRRMSDTALVALALRLFIRRDSMSRFQFLLFMDGLCSAIHASTTSRDSQQVLLGAKENRCRLFRHISLSIQATHRAGCQTQIDRRVLHAATMKLYSLYARDQSALHIGSMHQSMIDLGHFVEVTSELTDSVSNQSRVMMFELTDAVFQLYGGLYGDRYSCWFDKHCRIDCREWESLSSLRRCQLLFWFAQELTDWRHLPSGRTPSMRCYDSFNYAYPAALGYDHTCHSPASKFAHNTGPHESIGVLYGLKRNDFRICDGLGLARAQFWIGSIRRHPMSTIEVRIWAMSLVVCGDSCDEPTHQQQQEACRFIGEWLAKLGCPGPG
ncbi:MAG: U-box domain-containing protein, partial [Planctomycetota bacterium]|nr:U-box domain-containing protein [Planctomycetota bacterium]